jgi:predicted transcriptional regulator
LFTFDAAAEDLEESNDAEADDDANIAKLTTEIVAAYISHHQLRVPEVPNVINAVRG